MRSLLRIGVSVLAPLTLLAACNDKPKPIDPVPDSCGEVKNPLDRALCSELYDTGYRPILAADPEVCARMFVDLIGVRATAEQIRSDCIGKSFDEVVAQIQETDVYRKTRRRDWADRLSYSDALVDPGSIKGLDAMVDELYRGQTSYRDFAIRALSHPGFVGRHNGYGQPDLVAQAAFKAFLGRPATRPEALDVGNMWRPWAGTGFGFATDADVARPGYGVGVEPQIDPEACAAGVNQCETTLLGYASIEFPANGRTDFIALKDLTEEQWAALRVPGRLFVSLDAFWEAEVDDVLVRLLGYDLGALRPRARQALVDEFKKDNGNVLALERLVLGSWAYRQTAKELPDHRRPDVLTNIPFAYGPTKLMIAESWLHSIGSIIGRSLGDCDWRYPNLPDYQLPESTTTLEDLYPRHPDGTYDLAFRDRARAIGGCPGAFDFASFSVSGRSNHIGLITAVAQEEELVKICFLGDIPALMPANLNKADTRLESIEATARHVLDRIQLDAEDLVASEVVDAVIEECTDCNVESVARGLCSGLLGGIRFLTY